MGRGHGSGRGTSAKAGGFQGDASMRGMSAGLAKALMQRENAIRNDIVENISVFDEKGNVAFQAKSKDEDSVDIPWSIPSNSVITHNHPAAKRPDQGGSFSKKDIIKAVVLDAKEIRAVTPSYTYRMKRPAKGWGTKTRNEAVLGIGRNGKLVYDKSIVRAEGIYKRIFKRAELAESKYIQEYKGDKRVAARRSSAVFWHQVNKDFAKQMGFEYTKTKVH